MTLGQFFFKYRSYTPIILLIPMMLYARPTIPTIAIGAVFVILGELFRFWGVAYAGSETRTTDRVGGTYLVTQGPFSYVRNPLYVGNILMYFGIAVMSNSLFPFLQIFALIYFTFQYYYIIIEEEGYLREKFQEKYNDYFSKVSRFFPGSQYEASKQSTLKLNLKAAYESEKRTFQAVLVSSLIIVVIYFLINQ